MRDPNGGNLRTRLRVGLVPLVVMTLCAATAPPAKAQDERPPQITHVDLPLQALAGEPIPVRVAYDAAVDVSRLTVRGLPPADISDGTVSCPAGRGTCILGPTHAQEFVCAAGSDSAANVYRITVTIADREGREGAPYDTSFQCVAKLETLPWLTAGGTVAAGLTTLGAFLTPATSALAQAVQYAAGILATVVGVGAAISADPPDPDFMVIAEPEALPTPSVPPEDGVTPELAAALSALFDNYARTAALEMAFLQSIERVQGAAAAQDVVWYSRQMDAAKRRLASWASLLDAQPALHAQVANAAQAAGFSEFLTIVPSDVLIFQAELAVFGLPTFVLDILDALGADAATRQLLVDLLLHADAAAASGSVLERLTDPVLTSALHEAARELSQAFTSVPLERPPPCDPGQ